MPGDQCYDPQHSSIMLRNTEQWAVPLTGWLGHPGPSQLSQYLSMKCVGQDLGVWLCAILLGPDDNHLTLNIPASCWPKGEIAQNSPVTAPLVLLFSYRIVKHRVATGIKMKISTWLDSLQSHCPLSSSTVLFSQFEVGWLSSSWKSDELDQFFLCPTRNS